MNHMRALGLLDGDGKPIAPHVERVLARLLPRLRRQFPALQDDVALTEVMEEAARRIVSREERGGPIDRIHGYAWVTIRSVAMSYLRRPAERLIQNTLGPEASEVHLALTSADYGSPDQVERGILLREALDTLSPDERMICLWKRAGFSAKEIAVAQGRSVAAVDTLYSRAKQKIRVALGIGDNSRVSASTISPSRGRDRARARSQSTGTRDGRHTAEVESR